jgi:hypothetical protein
MSDELEILIRPDGKTEIKVIKSKGDCHAITKPLEQALGTVAGTTQIHNPGTQTGQQIKG